MKNLRLLAAFFLSVATLCNTLIAQPNYEKQFSQVDSLFSQWAKPNSPGATIGIYKDGDLIYAQGYGMANLEYDIPNKPNSIFHIASISKQFTNFAILLLEEEGKLSIEDDIRKHMPEIHDFGTTITIRHLMHHTSGFRDQWQLLAIAGWRLDDVITKEHILKMILGQRELNFEPGSEYRYSNSGYSILARIVEKVSGQSFREFAQKRIFSPLEMNDTHVHDDHQMIVPRRTYSYGRNEHGFIKAVLSYANDGATSMFTTSEDLGKWMDNMLHPKLGKSFVEKMRVKGILNNGETINYGLGQSVGTYKGLEYVGHGGADAGFRSSIRWYPEHDFGVVVLSNLGSFNPQVKVNQITDIFLKEDLVEPEEELEEEINIIELPAEVLNKFRGRYTITQYDINLKIDTKAGKLEVFMEWDGDTTTLSPYSPTKFIDDDNLNMKFSFQMNADTVESIEINANGSRLKAIKYIFFEPDPKKLEAYTGQYYCPETDSYYNIELSEEGLIATHNRHADIALTQKGILSFSGNAWWMGKVDFFKDKKGKIEGITIGGGRVENLKFYRK